MGFELCYLPDMPAVLRALARAENSIEKWWQQLEAVKKHPEGSFKVVNALAMAASYDPDPTQFLGIRLPVTFDTCEIIEERWAAVSTPPPVIDLMAALKRSLAQEPSAPEQRTAKRKRTKQAADRRQPALLLPLTGARKGKQQPSADPAVASIKKRSRGA
jgi:hypothetical protein